MAVEIKGLDSLMRKLDRMGGNVMEPLRKAVKQTTEVAKGDAKALITNRTGNLSRSIDNSTRVVETDTEVTGIVAANTEYAIYVELGTSRMKSPHGYPYMMPAFNANKPVFVDLVSTELRKAIKRIAGGG